MEWQFPSKHLVAIAIVSFRNPFQRNTLYNSLTNVMHNTHPSMQLMPKLATFRTTINDGRMKNHNSHHVQKSKKDVKIKRNIKVQSRALHFL